MSLVITKETGNFFSLVLDEGTPIISEQNRLTTIGDFCNFKTANGANLILKQNINYRDITIVTGVSYIPTSINNLWTHLIDNGFFTGLGLSSGASGVVRFDELLDTFSYFGRDGQLLIVNESELKLDTVAYQVFTEADALKLDGIETGAQVNVNANWNESNPESDAYIFNKPTFDGAFENLDNKQDSLVLDGTGIKYPTVDAVNAGLDLKANLLGGNNFTGDQKILSGIVKVGDRPVSTRAISFSASLNDFIIDNTTSGHSFEESSRLIAATNNASFGFYDCVPTIISSGAINPGHFNGYQSRIRYEGDADTLTGGFNGINSFYSDIFIAGDGDVYSASGLYIQNATVTGTGDVLNQYGIIIGNLDAGTVSNRGVACYTYRNFLQGLAIGSDVLDLDNPLRVEGNGKITGELSLGATTEYADNAAAIAGGLTIGKIYRTGDLLKIVH